ncbi:hypothetical protein SS50377_28057 [Spironucleus salmonicida]|uniref:Uncharacterized protein n=1 Tax=Spironucleus salmonicida TaxID=348837 RepID=A0A9P8RV38_9EUKA|nr:hypothetical protein SS50377_28057 [Spironucleus salmonicida]
MKLQYKPIKHENDEPLQKIIVSYQDSSKYLDDNDYFSDEDYLNLEKQQHRTRLLKYEELYQLSKIQ